MSGLGLSKKRVRPCPLFAAPVDLLSTSSLGALHAAARSEAWVQHAQPQTHILRDPSPLPDVQRGVDAW